MKHKDSSSRVIGAGFWIGTTLFLLGALLFYGLTVLPPVGDMNPTFHVASRYLDKAAEETGVSNSFLAILLDYRSFDLVLLSIFFLTMTLMVLLFREVENLPVRSLKWGWALVVLLSSLGWFTASLAGLGNGNNFMDYEFWARIFGSSARANGAWIMGALFFITLMASWVLTWKVLVLGKEKHFGDS